MAKGGAATVTADVLKARLGEIEASTTLDEETISRYPTANSDGSIPEKDDFRFVIGLGLDY